MGSTPLNIDSPVNRFVNEFPHSASIFQSVGIDFCCSGQKSLAEACAEKGLDPIQLFDTLRARAREGGDADQKDWTEANITELVDHLELTHHVYVKKTLPDLTELMTRVVGAHAERHPEVLVLDQLVRAIVADMGPHLRKEEQILFPAIRKMEVSLEGFPRGGIASPIRALKGDHDNFGGLLSQIRNLTMNFTLPEDACPTWRALYEGLKEFETDTHLHVHKENNILFPMALEAEQG